MTKLTMTKIVVADLEGAVAFYSSVCGFRETGRFALETLEEAIMQSADGSGATLVILKDGTSPAPGEAILVFETDDLAAFAARVDAAGGRTTAPITRMDKLGISFAMFTDPEGHVVEGIERHA